MNTNSLAKLYDTLRPHERLPLLMAAGARGDQAEQRHLRTSAPRQAFEVADYFWLGQALRQAADLHMQTLLELAANFWQLWGLWMIHGVRADGEARRKKGRRGPLSAEFLKSARAGCILRYYACRFVAHLDGWKQFYVDRHMDPQVILPLMPGWATVARLEGQARDLAFTTRQAETFVSSERMTLDGADAPVSEPAPVETAAEVAKDLHAFVDALLQKSTARM